MRAWQPECEFLDDLGGGTLPLSGYRQRSCGRTGAARGAGKARSGHAAPVRMDKGNPVGARGVADAVSGEHAGSQGESRSVEHPPRTGGDAAKASPACDGWKVRPAPPAVRAGWTRSACAAEKRRRPGAERAGRTRTSGSREPEDLQVRLTRRCALVETHCVSMAEWRAAHQKKVSTKLDKCNRSTRLNTKFTDLGIKQNFEILENRRKT